MSPQQRQRLWLQIIALAVGTVSGAVASYVHMPLPWMLGAMLGTTTLAMAGVKMRPPVWLRPKVIPILGVLLGSSLTMEVLNQAVTWLPSILLMPVFIVVATMACMAIYRYLGGYSSTSAYFASMPGGLNEMILLSAAYGGDERRVALAHGIRILLTIALIALIYGLTLNVSSSGPRNWVALDALTLSDYFWLGAAAVIGGALGAWLKMPAGVVMLPMILSGILHVFSVVTVAPPSLLVIAAQVVMGSAIGARFAGTKFSEILPDILLGAASTVAMVLIAAGFALAAFWIAGTDYSHSFLAFAPGGLSEMSLLALALGQAVAYVSVMHIIRIVLVVLSAPYLYRLLTPRRDG